MRISKQHVAAVLPLIEWRVNPCAASNTCARPASARSSLRSSPVVVVVDRRLGGLGLRARLVVVHLRDLRRVGRVLRPLVVARADEAREAQRDALGGEVS